ncbi:MAG: thiamine phosphate synthase [Clostridiales bacterium]|nr:thiamine phosphate synthase [Clostridiales bacterium]
MNCEKKDLILYAVTDRSWLGQKTLAQQVEEALMGGITMLQLREKSLGKEEFLAEAREIKELCDRYGVPLIINDDVEIAGAVDAAGVHLGQEDMDPGEARKILGPEAIIGVSARTAEQALLAQQLGADYLGVGDVFGTATKGDAKRISRETLAAICHAVDIPVAAIGGITAENVTQLKGSGIAGVAIVSAVFAQKNIKNATEQLKNELNINLTGDFL